SSPGAQMRRTSASAFTDGSSAGVGAASSPLVSSSDARSAGMRNERVRMRRYGITCRRMRWRRPLLIVAIFLTVVGSRLWLPRDYANPVPVWDQWDGEAASVLAPWLHGHLRAADFFKSHNEHRIAMTRATAFLLLLANG